MGGHCLGKGETKCDRELEHTKDRGVSEGLARVRCFKDDIGMCGAGPKFPLTGLNWIRGHRSILVRFTSIGLSLVFSPLPMLSKL